jgi:predicted Zn-dependent peptidase
MRGEAQSPVRSRLPEPGPARPFIFPPIEKSTLASGLRIWTVGHTAIPVVTVMLLLRRGSADDPPGLDGLAALTVDMLDEGSSGRSAIDFHEALARIGAQLDSDIGPDAALLTITALSRFSAEAVQLLSDMTARPALTDGDFERVRQLRVHRMTQLRDMPGAVADRAFVKLLYGMHPYGHTPLGSERTLAAITVDDVRVFHRTALGPSDATLIVAGDCRHEDVLRVAATAFAGWDGAAGPRPISDTTLPTPPRVSVVPRANAPQSELRIGHVAAPRDTPDYHALVATNMVLGGQFVSRVNLNLRQDKGFTYGARTSFDFRRMAGPFALQVSVHTAATGRAIEESLAEIDGIRGRRPVTPDELALGVAALTRGFARNFETAEQIARAVSQLALYDLPDDYFDAFVPAVEGVSAADVTRVASRHLDPDRLTILVVGDLDAIGADLASLGFGDPLVLSAEIF